MFSLFRKHKDNSPVVSTLIFDEAYCHSAGTDEGGNIYSILPHTVEIVFRFPDYHAFLRTYLVENPYLPEEIASGLSGQAMDAARERVTVQLVQGGQFACTSPVDGNGVLSLQRQSLVSLDGRSAPAEFTSGAIAFGVLQGQSFNVLWATMYQTAVA